MAVTKIASTDADYTTGMLSVYPIQRDTTSQLYVASNNCQTVLSQSLTYSANYIIVEDTSQFPDSGILHIGPPPGQQGPSETVFYTTKNVGIFKNILRGFAGSRQNPWPIGSIVSNPVSAQFHNAKKDAIIQIENNLGLEEQPAEESLNGILKAQETRFLAPRPLFRAYPFSGPPPLTVRFQNFSTGPLVRYLWDFGDGTTSVEKSPIHTFLKEGIYTVKLNIITSLGAQGVATKSNYITVDKTDTKPFFYLTPSQGYSAQTAAAMSIDPTTFNFIDQTNGDIIQRYWVFDGPGKNNGVEVPTESIPEYNPNIHTTSFVYDVPGEYQPSLLILFENQKLQRAFLNTSITVL